jgi:hypothetical protein
MLKYSKSDLRLQLRAIKGRWAVPPALREEIMLVCWTGLKGKTPDDIKVNLARIVIAADKINLEQEKLDRSGSHLDEPGQSARGRIENPDTDDRLAGRADRRAPEAEGAAGDVPA